MKYKRGLKSIQQSNSNDENASKIANILQKNKFSWSNHKNGPVSLEGFVKGRAAYS